MADQKTEKPSAATLRAALNARETSIKRRLDALQVEAQQVPQTVKRNVYRNPLVSVGGSLLGGVVTGLLLGGIGKRKPTAEDRHRDLIESYIDAVAEDARVRVKKGDDVTDAIRKVLGKRTPVVIVEGAQVGSHPGVFASTLDLVLKTAVGFGVKILMDRAIIAAGLADQVPSVDEDDGDEGSSIVPVAAAASE
jgi:hypothetical protein